MKYMLACGFSVLCSLMMGSPANAQDSVLSKLNPFKNEPGQGEVRSSNFFNGGGGDDKPLLSMPKLSWPSFGKSDEVESSGDSAVVTASASEPSGKTVGVSGSPGPLRMFGFITRPMAKVAGTTKRALRSTVGWMNPFDKGEKSNELRKGNMGMTKNMGYRPQDKPQEPKKSAWRFLLPFDPEPEVSEPYDVNSFLRQELPRLP